MYWYRLVRLFEYSRLASFSNILLLQDSLNSKYLKFDCIIEAIPQIYLHIYVYLVSVALRGCPIV
jgi:hypothetical protein